MSKNLKGNLVLLLAAVIWGLAFSAQDLAARHLSTFSVIAIRSFIGALFLIPVSAFLSKKKGETLIPTTKKGKKDLLLFGVLCGVCLCIASTFQQFGISIYPAAAAVSARSGFLTALYVIIVPIIYAFSGKKLSLNVVIAVLLAVAGLYFLCLSSGLGGVYLADGIVLLCAVAFSIHIICVDISSARVDAVKLSIVQFIVCGTLSAVMAIILEKPTLQNILSALLPILFLGIGSSGIAYTLQIVGQQYSKNPTVASIIMSLESVFAVLGGALIGDKLTSREVIGCVIMFFAIIFSQLPAKNNLKKQ